METVIGPLPRSVISCFLKIQQSQSTPDARGSGRTSIALPWTSWLCGRQSAARRPELHVWGIGQMELLTPGNRLLKDQAPGCNFQSSWWPGICRALKYWVYSWVPEGNKRKGKYVLLERGALARRCSFSVEKHKFALTLLLNDPYVVRPDSRGGYTHTFPLAATGIVC